MKITDVKILSMRYNYPPPPMIEDSSFINTELTVWLSGKLEGGTQTQWAREFKTLDSDIELKKMVTGFLPTVLNHLYPDREE